MSQIEELELRERLTKRIELLRHELEAGRVKIADTEIIRDLEQVRADGNSIVIPETVSSRVRALALAVEGSVAIREAQSINLAYVQTKYFSFIEDLFSDLIKLSDDASATPHQIAMLARSRPEYAKEVVKSVVAIEKHISSFWNEYEFVVQTHLRNFQGTKAVYGGDIFPSAGTNVTCQVALYADAVVLPDPIHRISSTLTPLLSETELAYRFVRHGLTVLSYKPLVFSESEFPIAVFASGGHPDSDFDSDYLRSVAIADTLMHFNTALDTSFGSLDEVGEFLKSLATAENIERRSAFSNRLLYDHTQPGNLAERVTELMKLQEQSYSRRPVKRIEEVVMQSELGRMLQANHQLMRGDYYGGLPLIDAPNSWQYLLWKYEYDVSRSRTNTGHRVDTEIVNALIKSETIVGEFLTKLPPEAVIALRGEGAMEELREILRAGLEETFQQSEKGDPEVAERVLCNLRRTFEKHVEALANHRKAGRKFWGLDLGKFLGLTTLAVAAPFGGSPWLSALAVLAKTMTDSPKVMDLWKRGRELIDEGRNLRRTPPGILIDNAK